MLGPDQEKADLASDPSIAAPSPTYPYGQHSPYGPPGDMGPGYQHGGSMYAQPRPDWGAYGQHAAAPMTPTGPVFPPTPTSAGSQQQRANQVCFHPVSMSFYSTLSMRSVPWALRTGCDRAESPPALGPTRGRVAKQSRVIRTASLTSGPGFLVRPDPRVSAA